MSKIEVEVWSDYVCPFCYIGKRQLEQAIAETGLTGQVEIRYKAFELDATTPKNSTEPVLDSLARKYGTSLDEAQKMTQGVVARAEEVGLQYDFSKMLNQNTIDAHRLAKYAETVNKGAEMSERLMQAYFLEGQAIAEQAVLVALAQEVGLDLAAVNDVLADENRFIDSIDKDKALAQQLQVRGVPFFVINQKYGIAGAQPQQLFNDTLRDVAKEQRIRPSIAQVGNANNICGDDGCNV